jgi:GMP synthase (glutamine-hydrolysing)
VPIHGLRILVVNNYTHNKERGVQLGSTISNLFPKDEVSVVSFNDECLKRVWGASDCVILSGSNSMLAYDSAFPKYFEESTLISESSIPILGICFGHQLIARTFGVTVVDLGHRFQDFHLARILVSDSIFRELPREIEVLESHREIVSPNLKGLTKLATTRAYDVEALGHPSKPIFGVQFHPERYDEGHIAGKKVIENFLRMVYDKG